MCCKTMITGVTMLCTPTSVVTTDPRAAEYRASNVPTGRVRIWRTAHSPREYSR